MATEAATVSPTPARVSLPGRTVRHDLRAVRIVWQRELIRFFQDRPRIVSSLLQPVLFLFVLGTGLSTLASGGTGGLSLRTFMFPGVLAMATMFTALFSAGSIVWDREFGFLREMLVAPVRRSAIVLGKVLGGAAGEIKGSAETGSYADCRDDQGTEFSLFQPPGASGPA